VLSSWLPKELMPRIEINAAAQSLPTLVQHGTQDSTIEVDRARGSVEILRQLKVPLSYREYSMGHEISPTSLSELSAWLEEKFLSGREKK
jgi:phospholipase/carboxylesterase